MALVIKTTGFEQYLDPTGGAWLRCLIMGGPGAGKTPWSSYWPGPIIAATEDGLMSVADRAIPFGKITCDQDMEQMLELIRRDSMQPPERRKYRTFILDTVDAYQRVIINEKLKKERKETLSGWADYGWLATKTNSLLERLANLPIHVVVLMHIKDVEDEQDGTTLLVKKARLKGEAAETVYQDFDLIGLMENTYEAVDGERTLKRHIRWHPEPRFPMLRDRSGKLPRFTDVNFHEDDFNVIFNTVTSGVDALPETKDFDVAPEVVPEPEVTEQAVAGAPVPPDIKGGPVANPDVPRPAPAKKTAAKKTAAPAAAAKAEPAPATPVAETPAEAPAEPPAAEPEKPVDPVDLVKQELGATEVETIPATGGEAVPAEPEKNDGEPEPEPTPETVAGPLCGSQPPGLEGTPVPGCGTLLTRENAGKLPMAQLRTKTALCDECFDKWKADN